MPCRRRGREYLARNPTRNDRSLGSFSVNTATGAWADFADGAKGGDVISLYAYLRNIRQGEAARELAGIMVSNTTVTRPALRSPHRDETGGLSGAPLTAPSTRVLGEFAQAAAGRLALVGVGGIGCGADAYAKIRAGASAVQLYSALVFEGPGLVTRIKRELAERLRADGFASVSAAVGAD